ncbi:hypothetical protein DENSPDRAFT_886023 [Dentipellis sp. KUC8613]|nr:hypothetical protein DENSPDRAFT_886023 [Dentipellis sp. KUC8613]
MPHRSSRAPTTPPCDSAPLHPCNDRLAPPSLTFVPPLYDKGQHRFHITDSSAPTNLTACDTPPLPHSLVSHPLALCRARARHPAMLFTLRGLSRAPSVCLAPLTPGHLRPAARSQYPTARSLRPMGLSHAPTPSTCRLCRLRAAPRSCSPHPHIATSSACAAVTTRDPPPTSVARPTPPAHASRVTLPPSLPYALPPHPIERARRCYCTRCNPPSHLLFALHAITRPYAATCACPAGTPWLAIAPPLCRHHTPLHAVS